MILGSPLEISFIGIKLLFGFLVVNIAGKVDNFNFVCLCRLIVDY